MTHSRLTAAARIIRQLRIAADIIEEADDNDVDWCAVDEALEILLEAVEDEELVHDAAE